MSPDTQQPDPQHAEGPAEGRGQASGHTPLGDGEARYRQLADALPQLVWTSDAAGEVDYYNARAANYAGLTRLPDGSWTWQAVLHPDDLAPTMAAWQAAQDADTYQYEHRICMRDGSYRWHLSRAHAIRDADGRIVKWFGTATDIDDRKQAEHRVEQAASRAERLQRRLSLLADVTVRLSASLDYQTRLERLARMVVPTLADLCVVYVQEADGWIARVALAHVDPAQEHYLRGLQEQDRIDPDGDNPVAQVFRTGQEVIATHIPDGTSFGEGPAQQAAFRQVGPRAFLLFPLAVRGQIHGAINFVIADPARSYSDEDVTFAAEVARRGALAIENARLYREAQDAITLRDQFLSVAAHELKTPLTALLGNAQLLQRRTAQSPVIGAREQRNLEVVVQQAQRLNALVSALLDLSRLETGQLSIRKEPIDLCALVRRAVETTAGNLDGRTLELSCPPEPLMVNGDGLRLEQVFQNLIHNAVKYSSPPSPISVEVSPREATVAVSVRDQGIGVPRAALPHLFQRFFRASNATDSSVSGVGIGLYVVREIVAQHGGAVEVVSAEGEGSTFTVILPVAG